MLKVLRRIFSRRSPPAPLPAQLSCVKDVYMVPWCQYRAGKKCMFKARRDMCIGVWEKGEAAS
ncbi:MAG: hypothetical protein Q8O55_06650 [Dehalococcoidales bacterium]|nr:hypothetical protein [Dehalococcoidales bacterium]